MGKVIVDLSMSLDGFIAGANDSVKQGLGERGAKLHEWLFNGNITSDVNDFFKLSPKNKKVFDGLAKTVGAMVVGKRLYDLTEGWHGSQPLGAPVFVLTHEPPTEVPQGNTPFTFVTDGIESAINQAKVTAKNNNVILQGGADTAQQALKANLVDEINIHLVPILLRRGICLFEDLGSDQIELEITKVIDSPEVTHLKYKVAN